MGKKRSWDKTSLIDAVKASRSIREVLGRLGLRQAGGNYQQIQKYLKEFRIPAGHLKGKGWSKGLKVERKPLLAIEQILVKESTYQTHKLKKRLFTLGLKTAKCELCGWARRASDGRIPLELDHRNGDSRDHRLENLRILCPNCHSLQPTHRGKNIKRKVKRIFLPG